MTESDASGRQREDVLSALGENREQRQKAESELERIRSNLVDLLGCGVSLSQPIKIAQMARAAGISRETAHKLLRRRTGMTDG